MSTQDKNSLIMSALVLTFFVNFGNPTSDSLLTGQSKNRKKNSFQSKCYVFLKFLFSSLEIHRVPLSFLKIKFSGSSVCVAGVGWVKTAGQIFSQKPTLWCKWASTSTHEIHARATECSTLHFCIISLPCNQSSLQMLRT